MSWLIGDQRGVSAIVGLVLVIGLVTMAMCVYLTQQMPEDWREKEYDTMEEVKNSFLVLRKEIGEIGPGQAATVKVRMGTPSPTAMMSATTNAELKVVTAKDIGDVEEAETDNNAFQWWRGYGTYVREAQPTANYTANDYENDHLLVSTTQNQRMRTYLKFDLSESYLYDGDEYVFYDDAQIEKAELLLYCTDADLVEDPDNVMDIRVPMVAEVWGVENDAWDEGLDWDPQPHSTARDVKLENTDIDDEGEWVAWDVTLYLKREFEKYRGWGKWYQEMWWDNLGGALETGRFAPATSDYSGYSRYYTKDPGVSVGYSLTGSGTLISMAFDAGDNNAFWNYISYSYTGAAPTVNLYFDNDTNFADAYTVTNVPSGYKENVYARYAQYRVNPNGGTFRNIILEYTCHVSFVLREPADWAPSTLRNRATFNSTDNSQAAAFDFDPRLRITYTRRERLGYPSKGLIDFGYIKYKANNVYFPSQYYTYEGGMVYVERDPGWYQVALAEPKGFVTITPAEGNNIRLTVTRYQIEEGSIGGEVSSGTGYTSIRVQREEEKYLVSPPAAPNRSEVKITIRSDQPAVWRDYLERLAAEVNYKLCGEWDTYGDYVLYDYDSVSLTIYGKNLNPGVQDIYYTEKIVWLDTTLGYFSGGRT